MSAGTLARHGFRLSPAKPHNNGRFQYSSVASRQGWTLGRIKILAAPKTSARRRLNCSPRDTTQNTASREEKQSQTLHRRLSFRKATIAQPKKPALPCRRSQQHSCVPSHPNIYLHNFQGKRVPTNRLRRLKCCRCLRALLSTLHCKCAAVANLTWTESLRRTARICRRYNLVARAMSPSRSSECDGPPSGMPAKVASRRDFRSSIDTPRQASHLLRRSSRMRVGIRH